MPPGGCSPSRIFNMSILWCSRLWVIRYLDIFLFFNEGDAAALMDDQVSNPFRKGVGHELTDTAQPDSVQSLFHSKDEQQVKGIWAQKVDFELGWARAWWLRNRGIFRKR